MTKHTPGPWDCYSGWTIRAKSGKQPIAQAYCDYCADTLPEGTHRDLCIESEIGDREALANATLIAAAPDMLETEQELVKCFEEVLGLEDNEGAATRHELFCVLRDFADMAQQDIDKATS